MTTRLVLSLLLFVLGVIAALIVEIGVLADLWFVGFGLGVTQLIATLVTLQALGETPFTKWHHAYIGFALACIPGIAQPIGLLIGFDDLYQHRRQLKDPAYESPLHRIYVSLYRAVT